MADRAAQLATALVWLTRLPVARWLKIPEIALSQAAWAFPLAGLAVAMPAAAVLLLAAWLGFPPSMSAILSVAVFVWLTGGLHEDGLADYADGCGGSGRERALEIMRDSRIGSYGVLVLFLVLALRIAALASLGAGAAAAAVMVAAMLSRAGMAVALASMPAARRDGLGRAAGRAPARLAGVAVVLAVVVSLPLAGTAAPAAAAACAVGQLVLARQALRRLGGQTGDVLGAIQQVGEAATLLALVVAA